MNCVRIAQVSKHGTIGLRNIPFQLGPVSGVVFRERSWVVWHIDRLGLNHRSALLKSNPGLSFQYY